MKIEKLDRDRAPVRKITISFTPEEVVYIHRTMGLTPSSDGYLEMYTKLSGLIVREQLDEA